MLHRPIGHHYPPQATPPVLTPFFLSTMHQPERRIHRGLHLLPSAMSSRTSLRNPSIPMQMHNCCFRFQATTNATTKHAIHLSPNGTKIGAFNEWNMLQQMPNSSHVSETNETSRALRCSKEEAHV